MIHSVYLVCPPFYGLCTFPGAQEGGQLPGARGSEVKTNDGAKGKMKVVEALAVARRSERSVTKGRMVRALKRHSVEF